MQAQTARAQRRSCDLLHLDKRVPGPKEDHHTVQKAKSLSVIISSLGHPLHLPPLPSQHQERSLNEVTQKQTNRATATNLFTLTKATISTELLTRSLTAAESHNLPLTRFQESLICIWRSRNFRHIRGRQHQLWKI